MISHGMNIKIFPTITSKSNKLVISQSILAMLRSNQPMILFLESLDKPIISFKYV
jgi:hypothetical protein